MSWTEQQTEGRSKKSRVHTGCGDRITLSQTVTFGLTLRPSQQIPVNIKIGSDFTALFLQVEGSEIKNISRKGEPCNALCARPRAARGFPDACAWVAPAETLVPPLQLG